MQDEALLRRDKIIDAVGATAERFLRAPEWRSVVDDALRLIGEAMDANRVQVYENDFDDQGQVLTSMRFEWVSAGIESVIGRDDEQNFPMDDGGFSRWVEVLRDAGVVQGPLETLPDAERAFLETEGSQSVLAVPIFFEDRWWGWIGLDDCVAPRVWSSAEVDAVRAIAGIIGAAGTRERMERRARDSEAKYRTLVEHLPAVTYIATGDTSTATLFISPQVKDLLGYSPSEWLKRRGIWSELVHPDDRARVFAHAKETALTGEPYRAEYRMQPRYGGEIWVLEEAVLVRDEDRKPKYWQGMMLDITAQKTAESQAAAAERRYQALIEQVPAMIYTEDLRGAVAVTYISPRAEAVLGFPAERWLEDPTFWLGQIHPDDRGRVSEEVARADQDGSTAFRSEYRIFTADGRELWFRDEAALVVDELGAPVCWQGMMLDVTDQKMANERLAEAEDQFRTLVEQTPGITYVEGIVTLDEEVGALLYISPQVEQVLGYPQEKWLEDPRFWDTVIHDDDWPEMDRAYDEAMVSGIPVHMEYRVLTADGRWRWMHDESQLVRDADGKPRFWQGIMHDITDQKASDDRMRQAEERYRSLVEQIPSAAYTVALDGLGKSLYMSPRIEAMLGTPPQEWIANEHLWEEMLHPDDREEMTKQGETARDTRTEFNVEYRMIARDGRTVWIHDQARLMRDESGEPLYWQGVLADITEQRRSEVLEEELALEREGSKRLRDIDEMKNTFLTAVSHDLRTPLAAILGLAITLEREDLHLVLPDGMDLVRRISANSRKLDRLVSDLLDLDRLTRGILEPKRNPTDVGALVRKVVDEADFMADHPVHVEADSVVLSVDGAKVERIVENLLANAARHTPRETRVWVRVRAQEDGVLIIVEDAGPGVTEELRDSVFEPFRQGEQSKNLVAHAPGVGIGLSLVTQFTQLHGGRAWVEEREGGGASFRVFIPPGETHFA